MFELTFDDLVCRRRRQVVGDADVPWPCFRRQIWLRRKELRELAWGQGTVVGEDDGRHHRVAHLIVGNRVDGDLTDVGEARQDSLDGPCRHVLAVDAHPVAGSAREVEPSVDVLVGEVARPVHAVAQPFRRGRGVVVVAGEHARAGGVDDLADRVVGVDECTGVVELRWWTIGPGCGVVDGDAWESLPDGAAWSSWFAGDDDRQLGGAEAIPDLAVETSCEVVDVAVGGFVAERGAQCVVCVVGLLGSREDVGERFADVVHVGDAVAPNVVEES